MSELVFVKRKLLWTIFDKKNGSDGTNDQTTKGLSNEQAMTVIFSRYLGLILEIN